MPACLPRGPLLSRAYSDDAQSLLYQAYLGVRQRPWVGLTWGP